MTRQLTLPRRGRGRPSEADQRRYDDRVRQWRAGIVESKSTLDFNVSARGVALHAGGARLEKGDLDVAELEAIATGNKTHRQTESSANTQMFRE
jgi:hypothetical protein